MERYNDENQVCRYLTGSGYHKNKKLSIKEAHGTTHRGMTNTWKEDIIGKKIAIHQLKNKKIAIHQLQYATLLRVAVFVNSVVVLVK